ncbi:hypothetical protein, partial [Bacillus sp. ISL-78]
KKLIHHRTSEQNRIHKILQDANINLTSVLSDIFGVIGIFNFCISKLLHIKILLTSINKERIVSINIIDNDFHY